MAKMISAFCLVLITSACGLKTVSGETSSMTNGPVTEDNNTEESAWQVLDNADGYVIPDHPDTNPGTGEVADPEPAPQPEPDATSETGTSADAESDPEPKTVAAPDSGTDDGDGPVNDVGDDSVATDGDTDTTEPVAEGEASDPDPDPDRATEPDSVTDVNSEPDETAVKDVPTAPITSGSGKYQLDNGDEVEGCSVSVNARYLPAGTQRAQLFGDGRMSPVSGFSWATGLEMEQASRDAFGHVFLAEELVGNAEYDLSYAAVNADGSITWANFGIPNEKGELDKLAAMTPKDRAWVYCNWYDAATGETVDMGGNASCGLRVKVTVEGTSCRIDPAGNMANFS